MTAGWRLSAILWAAGAMLPASALAQETTNNTTSSTPATDAVGPRELQNFSLPGTRTQTAEPPAATRPATPTTPRAQAESTPAPRPTEAAPRSRADRRAVAPEPTLTEVASVPTTTTRAAPTATVPVPSDPFATSRPSASLPSTANTPPLAPAARSSGLGLLPWIAAALVLIAGIGFLLWQRARSRPAYADTPQIDEYVAPEPAPMPAPPRPAPRAAAPVRPASEPLRVPAERKPAGIVASRLRPSLDLIMRPLRCVIDEAQVTIDFEIELHNSGTAPARAVLAEAKLINAGANQEQELADFYARPTAAGSGLDAIPPLRSVSFTSQVVAPRGALQEYELAGRKNFVPIVAFNAVYEWGGSRGQTSAAFLVGRDTGGEKLGPLRADEGRRELTRLGTLELPNRLAA